MREIRMLRSTWRGLETWHGRDIVTLATERARQTGIAGAVGQIVEGCALQAHEIQLPEMAAAAKPNQQPRTKSCVVSGDGHCEA